MLDPLFVLAASTPLPVRVEHAVPWLRAVDKSLNLHPMFVSFTTAPFALSLVCDGLGKLAKRGSLLAAGWWCMFFAACLTPFTALFGWFFWMSDDNGAGRMVIHMWLGTSLAVVFVILGLWRWRFWRKNAAPGWAYLAVVVLAFAAMVYQAKLGGDQSFSSGMMGMAPVPAAHWQVARRAAGVARHSAAMLAEMGVRL